MPRAAGKGEQAVLNLNSTGKGAERDLGAGWGCWALSLEWPAFLTSPSITNLGHFHFGGRHSGRPQHHQPPLETRGIQETRAKRHPPPPLDRALPSSRAVTNACSGSGHAQHCVHPKSLETELPRMQVPRVTRNGSVKKAGRRT